VRRTFIRSIIKWLALIFVFFSVCLAVTGYYFVIQLNKELPDIKQLEHVQYQIPLSIYSKENLLIARFGEKKRIPVNIEEIPQQQLNAFIAAEDDRFYSHPGVDYKGLLRAAIQLLLTGKKKQGGSTITMQVTRNFLLGREKTYIRKIKEIILALKIEQEYSKNKILQLYLNKIYLGHRSYGIAAAVQTYYGKSLKELNLAQMAMIAGLPKAPSTYNPITNPGRALTRRNYVLRRMLELDYITQSDFDIAVKQPVSATLNLKNTELSAPFIAEMVRQEIYSRYGDKAYTSGISVYTTINKPMQSAATAALRQALHDYDQRHGYRALPHPNNNKAFLAKLIGDTQQARIIALSEKSAQAMLSDNSVIELPWKNIEWARTFKSQSYLGSKLKSTADIFTVNDIIRVRQLPDKSWALTQIPDAEAAFVALNPKNGAILALSGGFDFFYNKFNHATQSKRQPGSGFKPIIYTTALENGFTAASIINDAPVVVEDPTQESNWRPENYSHKFFGPTSLRTGLRKSRNLISIRLLRELGIPAVAQTALRFGFNKEQIPNSLSLALGSGYASPLQMARVYATFANGGFLISPYFIDRIENNKGEILFQATPAIACPECDDEHTNQQGYAPRIISSRIHFLMNSLLRDVVQRGTATRAKVVLKRTDLAGKTGTTNDQRDAWFNGFTPDIVATAWLGFDNSKPLGRGETGGRAALPIWINFMKTALKNKEEKPLQKPAGISSVYIDPTTGLLAPPKSQSGKWEYFRNENIPQQYSPMQTIMDQDNESLENSLF